MSDKQLEGMRKVLMGRREPYPDPFVQMRIDQLEYELDVTLHRLKACQFENSSLYRRVERLEQELQRGTDEGDRNQCGVSFESVVNDSADESLNGK
jgi:hypothetical protein